MANTFDLEIWFKCMEKYKITDVMMVPPLVILAIMSPLREKYSLKSARYGQCGAAPLDSHPQARFQALLPDGCSFSQIWGATESSCICSMFFFGESDTSGSVGRFLPNIDVKLVDDDGNDISGYGVRGELCVRGPTVTKGYYMNDEMNRKDFKDGYWYTGDIVFCDEKTRKWYVVDRKKAS